MMYIGCDISYSSINLTILSECFVLIDKNNFNTRFDEPLNEINDWILSYTKNKNEACAFYFDEKNFNRYRLKVVKLTNHSESKEIFTVPYVNVAKVLQFMYDILRYNQIRFSEDSIDAASILASSVRLFSKDEIKKVVFL